MKLDIQLFAYNTTTVEVESQSSTGSGGYRHKILLQYYFRIDETARTYKIYAKELFYHAVTDDNWTNGSPYNRLLIDGVQKAKTTNNLGSPSGSGTFELCPDFKGSSWQDMGTYNYNIEGKGSEHIIGVSCGYASSWAGIQRKTTEHRIKPPNISPANSTITSITDITLGNAPTIKWTPINSDDKFKITYTSSNGEASYTTPSFIEPGSTSEYTYNSDTLTVADFASEFSGETDTFTVQLDTYNSSDTLLGSDTDTFTVTLPSSVVPSVTIGTPTEADATMIAKNWGVFVQNKSKLSIPITATGIYDSTIQSIVTTINGLNFTGTPVATPTLVTSGTNTISTTATDSRGYTATDTKTYTVVPYSNPNIQIAQVQRCLSDGTLSDNGTYLLIDFKSTISEVDNNNTALHRIGYKKTTDANYTYVTLSSNYAVNIQDQVSSFTISTDYEYDIIFESTDAFMTATINRLIDTGFDLLNFNASGKSMAIGKVSTAGANDELLEIGLDTIFDKNVTFSNSAKSSLLGLVYPVGSIYISTVSTSPATLFGFGTWSQIDGYYLYAGNTYSETTATGVNTQGHILTTDEIPAHTHGSKSLTGKWENDQARFPGDNSTSGIVSAVNKTISGYWGETGGSANNMVGFQVNATHEHSSVGNGQAHTHDIATVQVYVWKRTA